MSWRDVNVPKAPGQMRIDSLQAIAHGSDGAMFFQWRQAKYGQEKFHSAMLGHRGEASRSFQETKAFGAELQRLAPVRGTRVRSRVALVVDWDSWWGSSATESLPSQRLDWLAQARAWNAALFALGHPVDTVRATGPFDGYDVVVVPNLYIADAAQAAALADFVERGGQLVVGPFSGVVDATEKVHDGGAPGPAARAARRRGRRALAGPRRASRSASRSPTALAELDDAASGASGSSCAHGTEVLARYASGELAGRAAAITPLAPHGDGAAWYLSAVLEPAGIDRGVPRRARRGRTAGPRPHRHRPRGRDPQRRRHRLHLRAQPRPRRAQRRRARRRRRPAHRTLRYRPSAQLTLPPLRRRRARDPARRDAAPFITLSDTDRLRPP